MPKEQFSENRVENVERAEEMAIAEKLVREWGDRYKQFTETEKESDPEVLAWFIELRENQIDPELFIEYGDKRAEMVGDLHEYEEGLEGANKAKLGLEFIKNEYAYIFGALTTPKVKGLYPEGPPVEVGEKRKDWALRMAYNRNLAERKSDIALRRLIGESAYRRMRGIEDVEKK